MEKRKQVWYWIITGILSFFIFSGGLVQALQLPETVQGFKPLGCPTYFISLIGVWKMLGVTAILIPKFKLLKEWAYAGLFFTMTGALISHLVLGDGGKAVFGPLFQTVFILLSWYFRPDNRKLNNSNSIEKQ